jgi:uncharacterized protein (DUF2249 family)
MSQVITRPFQTVASSSYELERKSMNTVIDFRSIDRSFRHAIFFSLFEGLKEGASFEFVNDHDPVPLYNQLRQLGLQNMEWKYTERGPRDWRIQITKMRQSDQSTEQGCCGICSGEKHKS